jgi:hypothetical protein
MKTRTVLQEKLLKFRPAEHVLHFLDEFQQKIEQEIERIQAAEIRKRTAEEHRRRRLRKKDPETKDEKIEREKAEREIR